MKGTLKSRRFFFHILAVSASLLLLLCISFTIILYTNARDATSVAIFQSETERNADLLRQSGLYWKQLISVGSSVSGMLIPAEELSLDHYWTRMVFEKMIASHTLSNNYTVNIDAIIDGVSSSPSQIRHDRHLGSLSFYEIFTQERLDWPYGFDLVTKSNVRTNHVVITVSAYHLSEQIFPHAEKDRLDILLTEDGTVLLTNSHELLFKNLEEVFPNFSLERTGEDTLRTFGEYYYTLSQPDKYGFRLLSLVPKAMYAEQYLSVSLHTALMAGCLFLLALGISVFLTARFYNPIKKTVNLLQTYIPEDIQEYENEIAFIHHHIEAYLKAAGREKNVTDSFAKIQSAHAAVLQHQINSHFLFNTLENIKAISVSELGIDNDIESSILMLNSIIREGVFHKNAIVPVSHELHLSRCYLELMRMRFPDVHIAWDVEDAALGCQVYKFTMQPILENCFSHGLRGDIGRPKEIHIRVFMEEKDLVIRVRDNGRGFSPGLDPTAAAVSHQVGMKNIQERITGLFGDGYGIRILPVTPGAEVEIRYPAVAALQE